MLLMTEKELEKKIESTDKKLVKMKLPRGEGKITWKNKATCYLEYKKTLALPDGTSKRISAYGYSIEDVIDAMRKKEVDTLQEWQIGQRPVFSLNRKRLTNKVILADAIKHWFYKFNYLNKRGRTFDREESTLKNQILKQTSFANIQIRAITDEVIQNFLSELMKKYSYSTVKKTYELLDQFFRYYYSKDVNNNPMTTVVKPKEVDVNKVSVHQTKDIRCFTPDEIERFVHEASVIWSTGKPRYKFGEGLIFIMYTGLRFGEAVALTWKDIDEKNGYLNVSVAESYELKRDANMQSTGQRIKKKDKPKTKAGVRKVYLISKALYHLRRLKELQEPDSEDEYIFATGLHAPAVSYYNLHRAFNLICKNSGIKEIEESVGLHTLRHTFISLLCRKNIDKMVIASIVGQADTKTIERVYYHIMQEEKDLALSTLDEKEYVIPERVSSPSQLSRFEL